MLRLTLLCLPALALAQPSPGAMHGLRAATKIEARSGQVIDGMRISNPDGPCVIVGPGVRDVTVQNSDIGPCGPAGMNDYGVWILQGATNITVRNNVIHDVGSGVKAYQALSPLIVDRNFFYQVRGPHWNGQAVQFNGVSGAVASSRVTCNVSDANFTKGSTGYQDHISMFKSSGASGSPIEIAYNRVRGGNSKIGGGITVGDNGGGWIHVHDNVVVAVANSGIGVAGGSDILIENNRVDNRGDGPASLTHMAYFVRGLAECSRITLRGNRGISRLWNWAETRGDTVPGYRLGPERCADVVEKDNQFGDRTLSRAMFDEVPEACR